MNIGSVVAWIAFLAAFVGTPLGLPNTDVLAQIGIGAAILSYREDHWIW